MTYQLTVLYGQPTDTGAFDAHYAGTHAPLAQQIPGVQSYTSFRPGPSPEGVPPDSYLVAQLTFADADAFGAGMGSEQGQAAVADVETFATGGATMLTGEVTSYV